MSTGRSGLGRDALRPRFHDLMRDRVQQILLVSSLYDSFILTEDGHLNEALLRQFLELNLTHNPDIVRVSSGAEALALALADRRFDMIVTSVQVGDMHAGELAERVRAAGLDLPIVLLAYDNRELTDFLARHGRGRLSRVFLWQGDVRVLLAIVKCVEDERNVAHDTGMMGVPAILVVEDNIRFYSSFLPVIYAELMRHTQSLITEGLNLSQKTRRMRARPKILLCETFEEAWAHFEAYRDNILGILSDFEFPRDGKLDRDAGAELAERVRRVRPDVPIVLQSSIPENQATADRLHADFLLKGSPVLLHRLRQVLVDLFGFGDFVFRTPDGAEIARARDLPTLVEKLRVVPVESIGFHGERNHFSMWLKARTEFVLADKLRPRKVADFPSLEHLRQDLIRAITQYRHDRDRAVVADFDRARFDDTASMTRIGGGSLGGKARGLAFANRLLRESEIDARFPEIDVVVPQAVVLATDIFDEFMEANRLAPLALDPTPDADVESRFLAAPFPEATRRDLEVVLRHVTGPLAVRSSGLLEDSPSQPFAGVYRTVMIPNRGTLDERLGQLVAAVQRVWASTFSLRAQAFLGMTQFRLEEEKMAVIIQRIVGSAKGDRFYPDFSGVARSHDFYPTPPARAEDGVAAVALGLGRAVVDGSACVRFSPRHPRRAATFGSLDDVLENSQREFWALGLGSAVGPSTVEGAELTRHGLEVAERDGVLALVGSTYSPDNDSVSDGISRAGVRLVSFAPMLKHDAFPLAELVRTVLEIGQAGTQSDVEIEFAVRLPDETGGRPEFGFLQLRPLGLATVHEDLEIGHVRSSDVVCRSTVVLGHGKIAGIRDLVVVDPQRFDRSKSVEVAQDVARLNATLQGQGTPYVLIGVGRWGSLDRHLGIPVTWNQIAGARVIIEAGFRDLKVTPSQGTHFFQNLTSCNVGYFTVNPQVGEGYVDWEWLEAQPASTDTGFVRHMRLDAPLTVKISGKTGEGVILKP